MSFEIISSRSNKRLETTEHIAREMHQCHECPHPIIPGDIYKRTVYLVKLIGITETDEEKISEIKNKKRITVYKYHYICPGDRYDEEEEEQGLDKDVSHQEILENIA